MKSRDGVGFHKIICGDSSDISVVNTVMGSDKASVVFTDPPYGVSIGKKNRFLNSMNGSVSVEEDIVADDLDADGLKDFLLPVFKNTKSVMADDCSLFFTAPVSGEIGLVMMQLIKESGFPLRHVLAWVKSSATFSMGRLDYDYKHEPIFFTWGKKHIKNKGEGIGDSVWYFDKPSKSKYHPTTKPTGLYEQAYTNHSDHGHIVFEPFSGSGTAILSAENTGRYCRAIEISPSYVAVALQRYKDAFDILPVLQTSVIQK